MANIPFAITKHVEFLYGGCGLFGTCCYGGNRHFLILEEATGAPEGAPQRQFLSDDNGQTWTEGTTYFSASNLWAADPLSPSDGTILVPTVGPNVAIDADDDVLIRSVDGGATWERVLPVGFVDPASDLWYGNSFIVFDRTDSASTVLWCGWISLDGSEYHVLRSTDGGATFHSNPPITLPFVTGGSTVATRGCYLGEGVVLLGGTTNYGHPVLFRSTDGGLTWVAIEPGTTQHPTPGDYSASIHSVADLGGGVVLACGQSIDTDYNWIWPLLFRSTDSGLTWTEITDALPDISATPEAPARFVLSNAPGAAVICIDGIPDSLGGSNWRATADGGITWETCTGAAYPISTAGYFSHRGASVADDGAIILTSHMQLGLTVSMDVWRGESAGAGPCFAVPAPARRVARPMVPARSSLPGCPQICQLG